MPKSFSSVLLDRDSPITFAELVDSVSRENNLDGLGDYLEGKKVQFTHMANRGDGTYEECQVTVLPSRAGQPALFTLETDSYRG